MRHFANLFLILFLADGMISTLDEFTAAVGGVHLLGQVRNLVAFPVVGLSVPFFLLMGMDRRIPKGIFLPMVVYALWATVMFWPMPLFIPEAMFGFVMAAGQLGIGLAGWHAVAKRSDGRRWLTPAQFSGPWFSWKNTLGFFSASALLVPLTVVVVGVASLPALVEVKTAGFMRLRPSGLYMNEKIYIKDGKTLRLIPMIHIGRTDFYDEIGGSMAKDKTLILAEGVTDRNGLLKSKLSYDKIGQLLGLSSQTEMPMEATPVSPDFVPLDSDPDADRTKPHIVSADVDLSVFSPITVEFISILSQSFFDGQPLSDGYAHYKTWVEAQGDEQKTLDSITHDIFTQRNQAVFAMLGKALPHYDTLIVPWGALHMPDIEKEAQRLGFFLLGEKERLSVDFGEALHHLQKVHQNSLQPSGRGHGPFSPGAPMLPAFVPPAARGCPP